MDLSPSISLVSGFRTEILPSAAMVSLPEWDVLLTENDFFHSHGWLRSLDEALGDTEVLTVRDSTGLIAGCALWNDEREPGLFYLPEFFSNVAGPWTQDFLWIGARRSTYNEIPCVSDHRRAAALQHLLAAAKLYAAAHGQAGIVIPYMPVPAALELIANSDNAVLVLHSAEASISIPSGGLSEAMSHWKQHDRTRTRAEIAAFTKKGGSVEWVPLDEHIEAIAAQLIAQNRSRYDSTQGTEWMCRIFSGQRKSGVIKSAIVALTKRDGKVSGLTVFYRFRQTLHARYFGSDYTVDNDFRYFVLTYYEPLNYAATQGFKQLRLSISALSAKAKRGAQLEPQAAVIMFTNRTLSDQVAIKRHNVLFIDRYRRQFANRLSQDWALI